MRLLSDSIEDFIKALMEDEQDQQQAIELRRNELAEHFQWQRHPRSIMFWPRASRPIMVM